MLPKFKTGDSVRFTTEFNSEIIELIGIIDKAVNNAIIPPYYYIEVGGGYVWKKYPLIYQMLRNSHMLYSGVTHRNSKFIFSITEQQIEYPGNALARLKERYASKV